MIVSNREIANRLEDIFKELNNSDYHVNPFFRISKATPEQMKKYQFIHSKFPRSTVLIYSFFSTPVNIIKLSIYLFCSVIFSHQYKTYNEETHEGEILFLSHAIGANITKVDGDQFFALMPEYLHKKNLKAGVLYTNHNLAGYRKNSKLLKSKEIEIDRHLIPKFLKPHENIDYLRSIIPASIRCLFYGLQNLLSNPINSILFIKSSTTFYSRSTYSNYLVCQRVQKYCFNNDVKKLVMTFEGHSYEQYILQKINKNQPNLSFILYQHSPVVTDHYGIEHFLKTNSRNFIVLTTGIFYGELLKNFSNIPKYQILGSSKAETRFVDSVENPKTQVLFAPEGTTAATISFLKSINYLCSLNPELLFSIRLHPNLKRNLIVNFLIKRLETKSNFLVSTYSLSEDLIKSKYVFYRSSAVGVEALMSYAFPVFYGDSNDQGLNVLGKYLKVFPIVTNLKDASQYLKTEQLFVSKEQRVNIFDEMFSKIDYEKLYSVLNI